jgi:hypothetical protein
MLETKSVIGNIQELGEMKHPFTIFLHPLLDETVRKPSPFLAIGMFFVIVVARHRIVR